jgi:hypothetical protein
MSVLYWLNDTETYARLIEQVRPFVEAYGSAEQRAGFLINMLGFLLRRDRYRVTDGTVEIARAVYAAAQEAEPSPFWWAVFELGFALLWHGDLDEADVALRESLTEGVRRGDLSLQSRARTYLMITGRKRVTSRGYARQSPVSSSGRARRRCPSTRPWPSPAALGSHGAAAR